MLRLKKSLSRLNLKAREKDDQTIGIKYINPLTRIIEMIISEVRILEKVGKIFDFIDKDILNNLLLGTNIPVISSLILEATMGIEYNISNMKGMSAYKIIVENLIPHIPGGNKTFCNENPESLFHYLEKEGRKNMLC